MPTRWLENAGLKVVSVFIAILLWLVVAGEEPAERSLRVPLEVRGLPANVEIADLPVETVEVRVRGASGALRELAAEDVVAMLDLQAVAPGRRLFQITSDEIEVPLGVEVVQVNPPTLTLRFETAATRMLPVAPAITGRVAAGYVVSGVTASPPMFEVIGPQSAIRQASELLTEPVSVEGATGSVRQIVTVGATIPGVRLRTPQRATVTVTVVAAETRRTLHDVRVQLRNVGPGLVARTVPPTVAVTLGGSAEALAEVSADSLVVYVDLSGLREGVHELPVRTDRGRGFGVTALDPSVVQVVVE